MPTLTFQVADGGGNAGAGDASVNSAGVQGFNPHAATGFLGRVGKSNPEFNLFFRFDISAIERGNRFDGTNLEIRTSVAPVGSVGQFRIGHLFQDGIWDVNGFANGFSPAPFYPNSYAFPNPLSGRDAIPHATDDGSAVVVSEIMLLNLFSSGQITYGPGRDLNEAETRYAIGDGRGGEDVVAALNAVTQLYRNNGGPGLSADDGIIGLTLDSSALGAVLASLAVYLSDSATPSFRPTLVIDYTENPPDITTTSPPLIGQVQIPYSFDADADDWILGDFTTGATVTLGWELLPGFPTGMTIDANGVVEWTPTLAQVGSNAVTIRVTNDLSGLTDDLAYSIEVTDETGALSVAGDLAATSQPSPVAAAASAQELSAAAAEGQTLSAESSAQTLSAEGTVKPLSVTVVPASIQADPE